MLMEFTVVLGVERHYGVYRGVASLTMSLKTVEVYIAALCITCM